MSIVGDLLDSGLGDEERAEALYLLAVAQRFGNQRREALATLQGLHAENAGHARAWQERGHICSAAGWLDEGIALYREILDSDPGRSELHLLTGHARKTVGAFDDAIESYRQAYRRRPDFGDAFWSLANTKTYRFSDGEIRHIKRYEQAGNIAGDDRIHLCFAAGKALEDRADYDASFAYYERGNALKMTENRYKAEVNENRAAAQVETCTRELFESRPGVGFDCPDPIFIVGLPRAGSTLLEQILASHSLVDGTMELHDILALAQRLRGRQAEKNSRYPGILHELDDDYFRRFGEQYIEQTRAYRGRAPLFIDKMPNNFMPIGLIRLILPNAKVIDARRSPMACCFSCFKQLFGEGQEFTYGLEEVGRYDRNYVRLMDHWDEVLPGFVLRVMHEDVVDDLETKVRRVLDFCGLPFEENCIEFHKTERNIRTPSSEQVRQPIFREGLERQVQASEATLCVIDRFALNIVYVGEIHRIFPDARFILMLRHPADCVLSCYLRTFAETSANASFHTLEEASCLYDQVLGLWKQFTEILDLNVIEIRYEDLVADIEQTGRRALEFIGTPWHPGMLDHERTARSRPYIRTASYNQVTQPLYASASGRWLRYREQLEPILPTLEPWIESFGYAQDSTPVPLERS